MRFGTASGLAAADLKSCLKRRKGRQIDLKLGNMWAANHPLPLADLDANPSSVVHINLGVAEKKKDCEDRGAEHRWYNLDGKHSACYHCKVIREGQHWKADSTF